MESENKENHQLIKKQEFRIKMNRNLLSCPRQKTTSSSLSTQVATSRRTMTLSQSQSRNINLWEKSQQFHQKRRQNRLNSMFRVRKQKLESITRYNKEFYVRLNSQQSHYTSRTKEREKYDEEKEDNDCFVFRTVDSRQSREILGPIGNFNPLFRMNQREASLQRGQQTYNTSRVTGTSTSARILKENQDFCTPIRKKLLLQHNPEKDQNIIPLTERTPKLQHLGNSMQYTAFLKTPQRLSKLPDIYSFF